MTTPSSTAPDLSALTRPSGAFAMLAVDQREALRAMFAGHQDGPVTDEQITAFKIDAVRELTPHASAVLLERQFALDAVLAAGVIDPGCSLIAAADHFTADEREFVAEVRIDTEVEPARIAAVGGKAMKLLVLWRPDEDPAGRIAMVEEFVGRCRSAGLISIIEPLSRGSRDGTPRTAAEWDAGVLAAARELGGLGADVYKAEVPLHGEGDEAGVRRGCAALNEAIGSPWVVLSSGVPHELFPRAVRLACEEGAAGFLAGRAVWRTVVGASDITGALRRDAVPRLRELCEIVDTAIAGRRS
ncbi:aldolase [Actinomadura vinacea]|uniref:Aldolase n=1 Tax=Actinomadura vinacea TaxID=115336 RepID=A0ABN3IW41_9ACTN